MRENYETEKLYILDSYSVVSSCVLRSVIMENIEVAQKEASELLYILNGVTSENYGIMRQRVLLEEIRLPKAHKAYLKKLFKKPVSPMMTGNEFNEYLKSFLFTNCEIPRVELPDYCSRDYFQIGYFLKSSSVVIKRKKQDFID